MVLGTCLARRLSNYPDPRTNSSHAPSHYTHLAPRILPLPIICVLRCFYRVVRCCPAVFRHTGIPQSTPSQPILTHSGMSYNNTVCEKLPRTTVKEMILPILSHILFCCFHNIFVTVQTNDVIFWVNRVVELLQFLNCVNR